MTLINLMAVNFKQILTTEKNLLYKVTIGGMSPAIRTKALLGLVAVIVLIALIGINAQHKSNKLADKYRKQSLAQTRRETLSRVRQIDREDPGKQMAEIRRHRKLREEDAREQARTPSRFKPYEFFRNLFR